MEGLFAGLLWVTQRHLLVGTEGNHDSWYLSNSYPLRT